VVALKLLFVLAVKNKFFDFKINSILNFLAPNNIKKSNYENKSSIKQQKEKKQAWLFVSTENKKRSQAYCKKKAQGSKKTHGLSEKFTFIFSV